MATLKQKTVQATYPYPIDSAGAIQRMLQTPGVGDDNGINLVSSRKHLLVEARRGRTHLLLVLDLCGDETSESNGIAADLVSSVQLWRSWSESILQ